MRKLLWLSALILLLAACGAYEYHGSAYNPAPASDFTLTGVDGNPLSLHDLSGKTVLLFFGYTHCPDVCPTTLANARQILDGLGNDAANTRFLFITVDPTRDTPADLAAYTAHFHPDIIGLTGNPATLQTVYDAYGIIVETNPHPDRASEYEVTHTARMYLIDPRGQLRLTYAFGTLTDDIITDIQHILKEK